MPLDSPTGPNTLASLGDFLDSLRYNGIRVGPGEVARLQHLFAQQPKLERARLKQLLQSLLIKRRDQQALFDALFDSWCPDREAQWDEINTDVTSAQSNQKIAYDPVTLPSDDDDDEIKDEPNTRWSRWWLTAFILPLSLVAWWLLQPPPVIIEEKPKPEVTITNPVRDNIDPLLPDQPVSTTWYWQVEKIRKDDVIIPQRLSPLELLLIGLSAFALAAFLWRRYRLLYPDSAPTERDFQGARQMPLPAPIRDDNAFYPVQERRQMVWRIDHFVDEDPTRRLALAETVDKTARSGGEVELCYEAAVYEREIWFWLDRQLESTIPQHSADQLCTTLRKAGLSAQQGYFTDVPHRVDQPQQARRFQPLIEEGQGRQAIVAIFTDGTGLQRDLKHPLHKTRTERLLRQLRLWPRLCFVDCSTDGHLLRVLLQPYRLNVIRPQQLATWLGGTESDPLPAGEIRLWAAVVALGGQQASSADAHTLRTLLKIPANPWYIDQLMSDLQDEQQRCSLINWLLRTEPRGKDNQLKLDSYASQALRWWQQRYRSASLIKQVQENPLLPWRQSLAQQRWQIEQALLTLHHDPEQASRALENLATSELRKHIKRRLKRYAAEDLWDKNNTKAQQQRIYCHWNYFDLPELTRYRLRKLGFAHGLINDPLPNLQDLPVRLALTLALLGAIGASAISIAAYYHWWHSPEPILKSVEAIHDNKVIDAQTFRIIEKPPNSLLYQVTLGSPRQINETLEVAADAEIPMQWSWESSDNPVKFGNSRSVLLRAGSLAQPIRACVKNWPKRSLVVIEADYENNTGARQLAIRLLDKGSADQVVIGTDWRSGLTKWLGGSPNLLEQTQLLIFRQENRDTQLPQGLSSWAIIHSENFAKLAEQIDFPGTKTLPDSELALTVLDHNGQVMISGGPEKANDGKITWVKICPGTFTMGDESYGTHTVALSGFEIAETETTNSQFDGPTRSKDANQLPKTEIDWAESQKFCQDNAGTDDTGKEYIGDLPTEAQWEYAARGGSQTTWSFGDDETQLKNYGWYGENSNNSAQPVGTRLPNPLGLYDMHGNVWEWNRDWYAEYPTGTAVDPNGPDSGQYRVLRGGSFSSVSPAFLRSANRDWIRPEDGFEFYGFRCVRVPPP